MDYANEKGVASYATPLWPQGSELLQFVVHVLGPRSVRPVVQLDGRVAEGLAVQWAAGSPGNEIYPKYTAWGINGGYYYAQLRLNFR